MDYQKILKTFQPAHEFFIGIDSDGCVFDTMEVKQKEFFIPNALKYFDLYSISGLLRETWEYVNLYSIHRGGNRFSSILKVFDLLSESRQIRNSTLILPDLSTFRKWVETETKLSNATLHKYFESNYDPGIEKVLKWSEAVNEEIERLMPAISPFPNALKAIKEISVIADLVIVSQTPFEALDREWNEHNIKKFVRTIAGQEHGTKSEHLTFTAKGKYPDNKILMIGDAKGDLDAAINNEVLFYPIIPGKEDESWKYFLDEGLNKFISETYRGTYETSLINEFLKSLPSAPPWQK
jgi:phosphoglycolate phosphatase-like HAD superfamily hydrolase